MIIFFENTEKEREKLKSHDNIQTNIECVNRNI